MPIKRGPDISGQKFHRWTAIEEGPPRGRIRRWYCVCDCGNEGLKEGSKLTRGDTKSCGCLAREMLPTMNLKHGQLGSYTYRSWVSMRARCNNPKDPSYARYGGRGIRVCSRWNDFSAFLADMGERPHGSSIDRIDNNGDYCPENCRWSTNIEQQNNKRTNRVVEFGGERLTISQWARKLGMSKLTLIARLNDGWTPERAITEPIRR
jgi:hypothetical protein